jgi:hypothetical protein
MKQLNHYILEVGRMMYLFFLTIWIKMRLIALIILLDNRSLKHINHFRKLVDRLESVLDESKVEKYCQ